jgi:hypothetical protein
MEDSVKIAGVDIDFVKAVKEANEGESIIIPSTENGQPVLVCWNIPLCSIARKQLLQIAKDKNKKCVKFYSVDKGHICTLVVI